MSFDTPRAELSVNGARHAVEAPPSRRLSTVLREDCGLTGTKAGCDAGDCGACTVLIDGRPHCACLTPAVRALGREVTTVEGLTAPAHERLKQAFLRRGAAQCGICTPGMLVAAAALIARTSHPTPAEAEAALSGVLCRCTGYRPIIAAVCDAADDAPAPPAPAPGRAVGAPLPRLDGRPKVDGTERFGADTWPEGALVVRAVRSPHHRARFRLGDLAVWQAARPGVVAVLTAADIPGQNRFGVIPAFADQPALAEAEARFRGEAVALVAGEREAMAALDLADFPVAWTPQEPLLSPDEATAEGAPLLHAGRPDNVLIAGVVRQGDAEAALARAAFAVDGTVRTGHVEHAYIEPEAGVAWMDGETLVIRVSTQTPVMDRDDTARVLGLPPERVRIVPSACGGGFGSKLDMALQPLVGLVALKTGRPARMTFDRRESMASTTKRHPARMTARIGCDAAGRLTAMAFDGDFDTGAYASWGPTVAGRVPVHASGPYRIPGYRAQARAIHTNGPIGGAFRGFGVPQAAVLTETLMDELADAAGLDRLAIRRLNAFRDGDRTATGQVLAGGVGIAECLDALKPDWERALAEADAANAQDGPERRGVGAASCWYGCGNTALPNPSTICAGVTRGGRVVLHQGAVDIGQGSNTVIPQLFADALGVGIHTIDLVGPDTGLTPDAGKTSASRQTYVSGRAAEAAGRSLRAIILRHANVSDEAVLAFHDGAVEVGGRRRIVLGDLPEDPRGYVFAAEGTYDPPTTPLDADGQGTPYAVYGWGAQMAELAVDMTLGTLRLIRITAAHDLGRVINPVLAEGQLTGGIAQGIGMALMEEYVAGRTENLHDYLIPSIGDVPEIRTIFVEKPDPEGPSGAKGLGEHALIPTAPAILNAIRHATGARITSLPARPDRVLAAIAEAGR